MVRYNEEIVVNGNKLTRKFIESLNRKQREDLIEPIFHYFRMNGFQYPDDEVKLKKEYKRLCDADLDVNAKEMFNNGSVATFISKYFCKSFYKSTEVGKKNMLELFDDDEILKKVIHNRLGLVWLNEEINDDEAFPISFRQIIQGFRSARLISQISMFKPMVARWLVEKYTEKGDVCLDPSAGFGGRMLGTISCGRKYIGIDPLTIPELIEMKNYFGFENVKLYHDGSENIRLEENSVDFVFTSPPYYNQEQYSRDSSQAYNKGEDYFYNIYWSKTLNNIKYMLKPNKIFALNVKNYPKMVEMADGIFERIDELKLRTVRSHLNKKAGTEKYESIYIYKNPA